MELNVIEIFFCKREEGQSDRDEAWSRDPIRSKISKMGAITAEPPYHTQVWEYPPQSLYEMDFKMGLKFKV